MMKRPFVYKVETLVYLAESNFGLYETVTTPATSASGDKDLTSESAVQTAALAAEFWAWRSAQQPRTSDDIPRLVRPADWLPAWSPADVAAYRERITEFDAAWRSITIPAIDTDAAGRAAIVDHALVGSAIARVKFELDVARTYATHPGFYVDACLGVYFDLLLTPPPFGADRTEAIIAALEHTPTALGWGRDNLGGSLVDDFRIVTIRTLTDIEPTLLESVTALASFVPAAKVDALTAAGELAIAELVAYRDWLATADAEPWAPIGEAGMEAFFRTIALNPLTIDDIQRIGLSELERAEGLSAIEAAIVGDAKADLLPTIDAQVERERLDELAVRDFYESNNILSQPDTLGHYLVGAMPPYLASIRWLGVTDDLTDDDRVDEDGISYMPDPTPDLSFFYDANARDPRAGIIHEGAHYQQLALSWRHPTLLRRRYYDSGPNEGIAFYNEELMLRTGMFDDAPGTRSAIYAFLRLRAMRVLVDVGLATGRESIDGAAALMSERVPMDLETALHEASYFASIPAQALTYQVGKNQILAFLADAARIQGADFDLRAFHDSLWLNGNVPIALQRFELLGLTDELDRIQL